MQQKGVYLKQLPFKNSCHSSGNVQRWSDDGIFKSINAETRIEIRFSCSPKSACWRFTMEGCETIIFRTRDDWCLKYWYQLIYGKWRVLN